MSGNLKKVKLIFDWYSTNHIFRSNKMIDKKKNKRKHRFDKHMYPRKRI